MHETFDKFEHRFAVGDIVARRGTATQTIHERYGTGQYRFLVLGQLVIRCGPDCIEKSYRCRALRPTGELSDNGIALIDFSEIEIEPSEPFLRENKER